MKRSTLINVLSVTGVGVVIIGLGLIFNKKDNLNNIDESYYYFVEENDNKIVNG